MLWYSSRVKDYSQLLWVENELPNIVPISFKSQLVKEDSKMVLPHIEDFWIGM